MYKFSGADNKAYDKYIVHLTREEILNGANLHESISRRIFSLQMYLGGRKLDPNMMGKLEFEMDMGIDDWIIGLTPYKKLSFMIANDSTTIESGLTTGEEVKPIIGLEVLDGENKQKTLNVPYGTYLVDSIAKNMSVKTYHCYDRLYYMKDEDCDFEGEVYSDSTTVGYILNKLTSKYPDVRTLSDEYKGDFAPYWSDVLRKPIKYENYVAPPEEDEEIMPDTLTPTEDYFPTDSGYAPAVNPGACCDCEHTGGGTTPNPPDGGDDGPNPPDGGDDGPILSDGLNIIIDKSSPLFADRTNNDNYDSYYDYYGIPHIGQGNYYQYVLLAVVKPYDEYDSENNRYIANGDVYIDWEIDPSCRNLASINRSSSTNRNPRLSIKKPGKIKIKAIATAAPPGVGHGTVPYDYRSEATIEIDVPNITSDGLLEKYWGRDVLKSSGSLSTDPRIFASDLSGWNFKQVGGGIYNSGTVLCTQTYQVIGTHTGSGLNTSYYDTYLVGQKTKIDVGYERPSGSVSPQFTISPCENFNAHYACLKVTKIKPGLESCIKGFAFTLSEGDDGYLYFSDANAGYQGVKVRTCYQNSELGTGSIYHALSTNSRTTYIPNFFLNSYDTNFDEYFDRGGNYFHLEWDLEESGMDVGSIFDGTPILEFSVIYYGKKDLDIDDYKYLTTHTGNSDVHPYLGNGYLGHDVDIEENMVIYHSGLSSCYHKNWFPLLAHKALELYYETGETAPGYPVPLNPDTGDPFSLEESIWYQYSDDIYEEVSEVSVASYSLMDRSSKLAAPSYDDENNLIVTYNDTVVTDPNDPYETPNENNQVRSKKKEEIGFEMKESQLLGYIAAYCGGNAILDHENELRLVKLSKGTDDFNKQLYDKHIRLSEVGFPEIHNCEASSQLGGMTVRISKYEGDDIVLGDMKPTEEKYVMDLDNPFMTKDRAVAIFNEMKDVIYKPMRIVVLSDPRLWLGDMVHFDGYSQLNETTGVNIEVMREGLYPIMKLISHYDGAPSLDIEATSSKHSDRTNSYSGTLSDKVDEMSNKVDTVEKDVNKFSGQLEELRTLVAYINELFAIEVNADNIVSATVNTRNIRIAPTSGTNGGVYIDGDSIDFIDNEGTQRLHIGSSGDPKDYYIRFLNENGYTRDLRALDPNGGCAGGGTNNGGNNNGGNNSGGNNNGGNNDGGNDGPNPPEGLNDILYIEIDKTDGFTEKAKTGIGSELYTCVYEKRDIEAGSVVTLKYRLTSPPRDGDKLIPQRTIYVQADDNTIFPDITENNKLASFTFTDTNYNEWQSVNVSLVKYDVTTPSKLILSTVTSGKDASDISTEVYLYCKEVIPEVEPLKIELETNENIIFDKETEISDSTFKSYYHTAPVGSNDTIAVKCRLSSPPRIGLTAVPELKLKVDDDVSLTFTSENYNQWQIFNITGFNYEDDYEESTSRTIKITTETKGGFLASDITLNGKGPAVPAKLILDYSTMEIEPFVAVSLGYHIENTDGTIISHDEIMEKYYDTYSVSCITNDDETKHKYAYYDNEERVVGFHPGKVTLEFKCANHPELTATCEVTVRQPTSYIVPIFPAQTYMEHGTLSTISIDMFDSRFFGYHSLVTVDGIEIAEFEFVPEKFETPAAIEYSSSNENVLYFYKNSTYSPWKCSVEGVGSTTVTVTKYFDLYVIGTDGPRIKLSYKIDIDINERTEVEYNLALNPTYMSVLSESDSAYYMSVYVANDLSGQFKLNWSDGSLIDYKDNGSGAVSYGNDFVFKNLYTIIPLYDGNLDFTLTFTGNRTVEDAYSGLDILSVNAMEHYNNFEYIN